MSRHLTTVWSVPHGEALDAASILALRSLVLEEILLDRVLVRDETPSNRLDSLAEMLRVPTGDFSFQPDCSLV